MGRIAVIGLGREEDGVRAIEDAIVETLLPKGYRLATRRDLPAVYQERRFQKIIALSKAEVAELGGMLKVQSLLIVNPWEWEATECITRHIHYLGTPEPRYFFAVKVGLAARLVSLESEILWSGSVAEERDVETKPMPIGFLRHAASELGAAFPKPTK